MLSLESIMKELNVSSINEIVGGKHGKKTKTHTKKRTRTRTKTKTVYY